MDHILRSITNRLSLREPQAESLRRLSWALHELPKLLDSRFRSPEDLKSMLDELKKAFPDISDFEREFPSLCFALATGVGKTRLMASHYTQL